LLARIGDIVFAKIVIQIVIVFVRGTVFSVTSLSGREWCASLALGAVSILLGAIVRLLLNGPFEKLFKLTGLLPMETVRPEVRHNAEWKSAIATLRDCHSKGKSRVDD
jgi:Ca2+-transporting ATPase